MRAIRQKPEEGFKHFSRRGCRERAGWRPCRVLPLQRAAPSVTSHSAMRWLLLPVLGLFCACSLMAAAVGTEKQPLEITASGDTNYENGLATAHGNVAIHTGDADIYADKATYNPKTHDIVAEG